MYFSEEGFSEFAFAAVVPVHTNGKVFHKRAAGLEKIPDYVVILGS
jgi:hypothetical protein